MKLSILSTFFLLIGLGRPLAIPKNTALLEDSVNNHVNISAHLSQEEIEQFRLHHEETPGYSHNVIRNSKRAITSTYHQYLVNVNGNGLGNAVNFYNSGYLFIFDPIPTQGTTNYRNAKDFILVVGSPAAASFPGAIRYYSNSYLVRLVETRTFGNPTDYSFITQTGRKYTITPDSRYAYLNSYSEFNPRGGLFDVYDITRGSIIITLSADGKALSGSLSLVGEVRPGNIFSTTSLPYRATINGNYLGSRKITF